MKEEMEISLTGTAGDILQTWRPGLKSLRRANNKQ